MFKMSKAIGGLGPIFDEVGSFEREQEKDPCTGLWSGLSICPSIGKATTKSD